MIDTTNPNFAIENLDLPTFRPPFWLKNPHLQTILPKFIPQPIPDYKRELHFDSTKQVKVAYDFIHPNLNTKPNSPNRPLAVMFHGLEGSSNSHYAKTFANTAQKLGWHAVVVHYRGCGGLKNSSELDYNAGDTTEIHHVFSVLHKQYPHIVAIGVSLGGNMLAKYMGEYGDDALCMGAVIVSAPVDLTTSALAMHRFVARHVYTPYLLKPLLLKAEEKISEPDTLNALKTIKTLDKFDDLYTAPRNGYGTSENYYKNASALPVLHKISKPTLIISAKDDPFLGKTATPSNISPLVRLLYSKHGGHIGFLDFDKQQRRFDNTWLAKTVFRFFDHLTQSGR
ncbi:hypothetical protein MOMA_02335 [Moraxella macacae 0408225]|uniref:AB hydrolase-1 domain-containing protein n=1 Tax=Moraxella macacae 0408225 TaxID=1230338 RepID=L2F8X4_9GAMM|nr:alpha/beta fold hydrolase [Moraxella macacae]ELA09206.1 hypothetical protein MOMA_02335 [Moraxella macacae 0408225]